MPEPQCGDCNLFAGRCVHVNGRRAATSTTPSFGCRYFAPRGDQLVPPHADAQTAAGLAWSPCPRCHTLRPQDNDGMTRCWSCREVW